jgi:glutamate synthase (NADPH/NADH) small chain
MEFLPLQNKVNAGDKIDVISAKGKHVVVIGGGDTGSDCVGTSNRHGAASVTQFELMPQPPEKENKPMVWPNWPLKMRTSSSHEEGASRDWSVTTKALVGKDGKVTGLKAARVEWKDGKMTEVPGSEWEMKADLVLLAMGFVHPVAGVLEAFGVERDHRGNAKAHTDEGHAKARRWRTRPTWRRFRSRRHAPWPVAGGVGDPRRTPVRPRGGRFPDGSSTLPR